MKYQKIVNNKEINAYLKKGDANLGTMGFTDHSKAHCIQVSQKAGKFLKILERMMLCRKSAEKMRKDKMHKILKEYLCSM